jgi:hypothetical protein
MFITVSSFYIFVLERANACSICVLSNVQTHPLPLTTLKATRPRQKVSSRIDCVEISFQSIGLDGSAPDAWRYMVEVQDLGKPADTARYR